QGAETDFHREFASILAQSVQLQTRPHGTRARSAEKAGAVAGMLAAKTLRDQNLDFLAEELLAGITEQLLGLRVHEHDAAITIDNDDGVGRGFQQTLEFLFRPLAVANIPNRAHRQRAL